MPDPDARLPSSGLYATADEDGPRVWIPGKVSGPTVNPPFDKRMYPALPWAGPIQRGWITEDSPPGPYKLNFLFNPMELSYDHSLSPLLVPPDSTAGVASLGPIGGSTLSFSLLFSRQYEVAYNGDKKGVLSDLQVMQGLVGMHRPDLNMPDNAFMWVKRLRFNFGSLINYTGYIKSLSVQISIFSEKMVPMFAKASITAEYLPAAWEVGATTVADTSVAAPPPPAAPAPTFTAPAPAKTATSTPIRRTGPSVPSIW